MRPATTTELADDMAHGPGADFAATATAADHEPPQVVARLASLDPAMVRSPVNVDHHRASLTLVSGSGVFVVGVGLDIGWS